MMATDTSQQYLLDAYLGEIRGEATFRLLADYLRLEQGGKGGAHLLENYIERVASRTS